MPRGENTADHPGRSLVRERWTQRSPGNITSPLGTATATASTRDEMYGSEMTTWQDRHGRHLAEIEEAGYYDRGGQEFTRYVAGPYRTQARAQVAAEALERRPEAKKEQYLAGKDYATWAEMDPNHP